MGHRPKRQRHPLTPQRQARTRGRISGREQARTAKSAGALAGFAAFDDDVADDQANDNEREDDEGTSADVLL